MRKLLGLLAVVAGCYQTPSPPCAFLCGTGGACPDGYSCSTDDNRCHLVESGGGLAACTDQLPADASHIDAMIDATPIDAMPIDAMTIDAAPDAYPSCGTPLAPTDDNTGAPRQAILISEIDPGSGGFIELYNNTASSVDLGGSAAQLVSDGVTVPLSVAGAGTTILAHGQATIVWPASLTSPADAGGELVLYTDVTTTDPTHIMSFVCWGTAPGISEKADAETGGKWSTGVACPGALTAGAIHRLAATDGLDDVDYGVASAPTPETCD